MLSSKKIGKLEFFIEQDPSLSGKFSEAGFGRQKGSLHLFTPIEAAYLVNIRKTALLGSTLEKLLSAMEKKEKNFKFAFRAYAMIRGSGRMIVPAGESGDYFRVYSPGVGRAENRPSQLLLLMPGKAISPKSIKAEVETAHRERLELIIATGTETEPKFYKISSFNF